MANPAPATSVRRTDPQDPSKYTALSLIGAALITYRVQGRPEQRAHIKGMAKMATALGALSFADLDDVLARLESIDAQEVQHG